MKKLLLLWNKNKVIILSIMTIAFPAIADLFAQTLLGFFDMRMVSVLGNEAISAVGVGNAPFQIIIPVFYAISIGTTALVSRAYGINDSKNGKDVLIQSLILSLPVAVVVTIIMFIFSDGILNLIVRGNINNLSLAKGYYLATLVGVPFLCFNTIFYAAFRSISKANIPMISNIISIFTNIFFNYIFIFVLDMGVVGAGIATTISRGLATLLFVYLTFFSTKYWISIKWKNLREINKNLIKRILVIGFPAAIEQGILKIGMLFFEMMVISLGIIPYAAHKIALNAEAFSYNMGFGFAVAGTALVGQQLGRKMPLEAKRDGLLTTYIAVVMMSLMGLLFFIAPQIIINGFTKDLEVKSLSIMALRIVSVCQPFQAISMVLSGCLRGAGDTKPVLWITLIGIYVIRLPITYVFLNILHLGLAGAWIVMTLDLGFRSIVCYRIFKKGKWSYVTV